MNRTSASTPSGVEGHRFDDAACQLNAREVAVVLIGIDEGGLEHPPVDAGANRGELRIVASPRMLAAVASSKKLLV